MQLIKYLEDGGWLWITGGCTTEDAEAFFATALALSLLMIL